MNTIQTAITGRNDVENASSAHTALVHFYSAFNNRDFEQMKLNWLQTEEASMSNPPGGIKRGWKSISEVYQKIFAGPAMVYVEFYDYSVHLSSTMFIAVGRERGWLQTEDEKHELAIRTTRIYTLHHDQWKQLHHHGSMDKPELLERYQTSLKTRQEITQ